MILIKYTKAALSETLKNSFSGCLKILAKLFKAFSSNNIVVKKKKGNKAGITEFAQTITPFNVACIYTLGFIIMHTRTKDNNIQIVSLGMFILCFVIFNYMLNSFK